MFSYARVQTWSDEEDEAGPPTWSDAKEHGADQQNATRENVHEESKVTPSSASQEQVESQPASAVDASAAAAFAAEGFDLEGGEKRELVIYAVPLMRNDVVFLPVTSWCEERPDLKTPEDWKDHINLYAYKLKTSAQDQWNSLGEKEDNTIAKKIHNLGRKIADDLTPEERLMKSVPKNVTKVIIYHPSTIMPDWIMEKITSSSSKQTLAATGKAALAGLCLPLAFGIDVIVIPGPQILTYYTLWHLYKNTNNAVGGQRLTQYVKQDGAEKNVRVNYVGDPRLDKFKEMSDSSIDGVMSEDEIEQFCAEIKEPELLGALFSLRERHLGNTQKTKSNYTLLQTNA